MHGRQQWSTLISAEADTGTPFPRPCSSARGFSHALWHGRSVRSQLILVVVLMELIAGLLSGAVTIIQARISTRVEVAASMELAQLLVSEAVALMQQEVPAEKFLADLSSPLRLIRHVRIAVKDAAGAPLPAPPSVVGSDSVPLPRAPAWFAALIAPPIAIRDVPVIANGQRIGMVEIVTEPRDEIAEAWGNIVALGMLALPVSVAVIAILYVLFGRVLDPLTGVARGLADLERRNYRVRLPLPQAQELAAITDRFNALAQALDGARTENETLNHRLITAQDDERKRTALELHDEVGPSLFGLKANASSMANAAAELPDPIRGKLIERVRDSLAIIEHLQAINRSMLNRLRPMALGHVPLHDILSELVQDRARQQPQTTFSFTAGKLARSYGEAIDLTVYRCVQENLTNVVRHAQAREVSVALGEESDDGQAGDERPRHLTLTVRDDGRGIDPTASIGFGVRGMQERVQALAGSYRVDSEAGRGTCVRIRIPLDGGQDAFAT
jgi:two-component system, NarL family, sensor histidine kinase UhpB